MDFSYRAITPAGRTLKGVEDAISEAALERILHGRGLLPVYVEEGSSDGSSPPRQSRKQASVEAVRYLSTLVDAGFPLDQALDTVSRLVGHPRIVDAVKGTRDGVRSGTPLASAMKQYPGAFPPLAVGMTHAGEQGGHLAEALERLAEHMEREERLRAEVSSALVYPVVMAVVGGAAIAVLMLFVLPKFVDLRRDAGSALPTSTVILMGVGDFLGRWWPHLAASLVALTSAGVVYRRSDSGRLLSDSLLVRLPVIGAIRRNLSAARFSRSLCTLVSSGMPIVPSLEIAGSTLTDAAAKAEVARAGDEVETGVALGTALGRGRAFPYLFYRMVQLGEEGGRLKEMLDRAARSSEQNLERSLNRLVRLVEPTLIVAFGIVAGLVALSLLQAIYGMRLQDF